MLTAAENEMLTRTGPGTPMGDLFRRFWIPVLLSKELPERDGPPLRVRILGEDLRAFRDTAGRVGLIAPHCPHRGADLFFGRNEQGGIRCAYHGWKYDVTGQCLEMPSLEPGEARDRLLARTRILSYPTAEWGDYVWAYMGPPERKPPLPALEFATLPATHRYVSKKLQQCNWAQSCEGGLDTAHFSFLHMAVDESEEISNKVMARAEASAGSERVRWMRQDGAPRFTVVAHEAGLLMGAARRADPDMTYWRISQFLMPNHGLAPNAFPGENYHGQCWVPIDDTHCWVFCYTWNPDRPLTEAERQKFRDGFTVHAQIDENYVPLRNRDNDYLIDRAEQKTRSFTGIDGVSEQDACIQDSQGFIADRTKELLGPTDLGIVRFRRLMLDAARALAEGREPDAAAAPQGYAVRSGGTVEPASLSFSDVMTRRFGNALGLASPEGSTHAPALA